MDDWELSSEELDSLERDALKQLAERNQSCVAATTSHSSSNKSLTVSSLPAHVPSSRSPAKPTFLSRPHLNNDEINTSWQARIVPSSMVPKMIDNLSKSQQAKVTVKFFLHATGNIAAKFPYDKLLIGAFHDIPRASWNAKERLWMFPLSSLSTAESVLCDLPGSNIEIENLDPLVRRAIAAAAALPDLQDKYDKIPSYIESKLLSFQREGIRFILQHGVRVLLADEMGLGKTLQAIAVTSCIREAWPVLILAPSSLRLHWASTIQQWLNIAPSDILVVLSQWNGSNRGGFNVVSSNAKKPINLDGVFNIISYDIVPKLQDRILASDFKVVIADESHFLKNGQAKRTNSSLPILQKAQYTILLSGTPALSRPIELFKQLEALYPDVYKNVHEYGNRYCKGGIFGFYQGASNHEELHNLMKATLMIRRLKKDVLSELPVKRRQQVFLELGEREMRQINALFLELETVKRKIKSCQSKDEAESLKFTEKNLINKIYTDSAEVKIPAVLDYLGTITEVITDNGSNFKAAGGLLCIQNPTLYWTPCAAHCIDLMLEDIAKLKEFHISITHGKGITTFVYRHGRLLSAMREKTDGRDLVRAGTTRFATSFLTLQSLYKNRDALKRLFGGEDWFNSKLSKTIAGEKVHDVVLSTRFWNNVEDCIRASQPLLVVLRIVDGDEKPAMAEICAAMDYAKDKIKGALEKKQAISKRVLSIIEKRWASQMEVDLYGAALFLNPGKFFDFKENDSAYSSRLRMKFNDVLEKMVVDTNVVEKISDQADLYENSRNAFGKQLTIRSRKTKNPLDWWGAFGCLTIELAMFAKRIVGICCSSSGCERNWSTFEFESCKFLIFAHHQPMIDAIHKFLLKKNVECIRIDGSTPAASRQALVTEFQEKDSVRAAVLSIKAGGIGLTLTAASTVIFAELSWTPGDIIQAEDRAHRIGQVSSVNIYYLLANDTVDDIIWDVIQNKLENLGQMLDGQENSLQVSVNRPEYSPLKASGNQIGSSPLKASGNQPGNSPMKQTKLDFFLKRCNNSGSDNEHRHKHPRT